MNIKANDLKKGDRVRLNNGWFATIEDNKKGAIRMATVEGFETEMGSVYAADIQFHLKDLGDGMIEMLNVTVPDKHKAGRDAMDKLFG
jgi:hypothetical protein